MKRADVAAAHDPPEGAAEFEMVYFAALGAHLDELSQEGLEAADELGRRALDNGLSMLDLVSTHRRARSVLLRERGIDQLGNMDAFLSKSLAAFEITQQGYVQSRRIAADARQRVGLLRGLSDAYLAIASAPSLGERLEQVCTQAQAFLDAEDARLEFGVHPKGDLDAALAELDEMAAELNGSGGRLILRARPGREWSDVDRATLEQLAVLISAPVDDARRLDFAQRLERVGAFIGEAENQQALVDRLLQDGVAGIGARDASLWLVDGDVAELVGHRDDGANTAVASGRAEALATVARTGGGLFLGNGEAIGSYLGLASHGDDADQAWAVLPVDAGARCLGALGLWFDERQPFDPVQRSFLTQLAGRVAGALERARAYERERLSRREAELASMRFRALQELATELSRAATRRRVAQVLLHRSIGWSEALGGIVATSASRRRLETIAAAGSLALPSSTPDGVGEALIDELLVELQELGPAASAGSLSSDLRTRLDANGVRSLAVYPITAGRRSVGVMVLGWAERFAADVLDELLRAQVAMTGPALHRAERYDIEHDIADTLQRSMLERPVVELEGLRWSVHYSAGSAGLAGGDWYDLYALDDHRLAVTVGDVVGRGVQAAASMGQLRSATRAMASLIDDPGELLTAIDEFTARTGQGRYSSMAYVVLDTRTGELEHSVAGHPPPVLRLPDGSGTLLETGRGPLLGIVCERETAMRRIPPGSMLVLYTDGLIERRTESVDAGLQRLVAAVGTADIAIGPEELCTSLAAGLVRRGDASDDVAIVAVELTA